MKRLLVIPARGGSKRIPNKNVRDFCGKPMIAHGLDAAGTSGLFNTIHVSTDSPAIAEAAAKCGYPVDFMRPAELADDFTPIMPVMRYVAEEYARRGKTFDQIWLLMACAPLIAPRDLIEAEKLFRESGGKFPVMAIAEFSVPVEWAFRRATDGRLIPVQPGMFAVRSQDIEKKYFDAGSFTVFPARTVLSAEGPGSDADYLGYLLPKGTAVDIDDEHDWALAEAIFRFRADREASRHAN